ncbi:PG0541 family transporter-associated protein [Saccharicrinis sp. FJH2]|uniref:PG0541 family transporter-associated protein n=1 Tax=Saccharicrinis sp. FJH65 TaxID=3344659 RepID=UPI0035F39223
MDKPALKAVFITYNQALTEKVEFMLDRMGIRGYTQWENVMGRGSVEGNPHMGTHTWPEINSSVLTIIDASKVSDLLDNVVRLDNVNKDVGIRAFVWDVTQTV